MTPNFLILQELAEAPRGLSSEEMVERWKVPLDQFSGDLVKMAEAQPPLVALCNYHRGRQTPLARPINDYPTRVTGPGKETA